MAMCDLAVAAEHARFGLPEGKVGVFPMQVLVYLRAMLHIRHINELCLTADLIDAGRAREMGLVNSVVPAAQLDAEVQRLIEQVAATSPVAIRRGWTHEIRRRSWRSVCQLGLIINAGRGGRVRIFSTELSERRF